MHTQTESVPEHRAGIASHLAPATGLGLYLLTLSGEVMLGASSRWLLAYLGAATVGIFVSLGLSAESCAYAAAFAPLAWSALGLLAPGRGRAWRRRLGARRASAEEAEAIAEALELAGFSGPPAARSPIFILDDPLPGAAVRGGALVLSRGLIETGGLAGVLGHELGHLESLDGRLSEALARLRLWGDRLAPCEAEGQIPARGGLLLGCTRLVLRLAAGGLAERALAPLWAAYWRAREYAADAHAAERGLGEELAQHLRDHELPFDAPHRRLLFDRHEHPPLALRLERLAAIPAGGAK